MINRFVVLDHVDGPGPDHLDWMFDVDGRGPLLTFKTPWNALSSSINDAADNAVVLLGTPSDDHRRCYLDLRGELSEGRGTVRSHSSGLFEMIDCCDERTELRILRWKGEVELKLGTHLIIQHTEPSSP